MWFELVVPGFVWIGLSGKRVRNSKRFAQRGFESLGDAHGHALPAVFR
jgi:hypothetical protein